MSLKTCFACLISITLLSFPANIIGCAGGEDPYDYYTSFFSQQLSGNETYSPFYYTGYRFLHDETEPLSTKEITSSEWVGYTNNEATKTDVQNFVLTYPYKQLSSLYYFLEKNQPLAIADSVKKNSFTKWFMKTKDLEALGYLMYAKQVEPFAGDENGWDEPERDAVKMNKLIKNGTQLWTAAKKDFIKLRYGYQITRLAFYNKQYADCISFYNTYIKSNTTESVLQQLSLSLNAGALKNSGKREEAAYTFSQLFAASATKRLSNYISFVFSTKNEGASVVKKEDVLKLCKTKKEEANVIGTFITGSIENNLAELKQIYQLDNTSPLLELLTIREINKLEEKFLSESLSKQKGQKELYASSPIYYSYEKQQYDSIYNESEREAKYLISFCHTVSQNSSVPNRGLFEVAAAYTAYMARDFKQAKEFLSSAEKLNLTTLVKDQWMLTNLLVTISNQPVIDAAFEEQLLPSVQWLQSKAAKDDEWKKFYRNLFSEILAPRYISQGDVQKAVLATGASEKIFYSSGSNEYPDYYLYGNAITYLREKMNSSQTEALYALMQSSKKTKWETYLVSNNSFSKDDVADVAGTAYLRENNWENAERWLKQVSAKYYKSETYKTFLAANPFADLVYDTHAPTKQDTVAYTKLAFARKMKELVQKTTQGSDEQKAKVYYQIANGLYQSSYWGNSWLLQSYSWGGNDGLHKSHTKGSWEAEYFGVFKAEEYYLKAKELSKDVNFKGRCVFMAAKCSQKQNLVPTYDEFPNYDLYDKANEQYAKTIRRNKYFSQFVKEYGKTETYKEVFNSCVYLRDYVKNK